MNPPYRLIAIDVDGTLLNSRNELPAENRAAVHRAHEAGVVVCLCTGRSLTETRDVIEQLGLDSDRGIFTFGSIVSELPSERTLHRAALAPEMTERLVQHFAKREYPVLILYDAKQTGGVDYDLISGTRHAGLYEQIMRLSPAKFRCLDRFLPSEFEAVRISVVESPADIERAMAELERSFSPAQMKANPIHAPNYEVHVVECFAPQVNKWYGISQVAHQLGIQTQEIAAIGDSINDLEMIREAGVGIAMGNASEGIKRVADWHAPGHDEGGVAAAIDALLSGRNLRRNRVA